MIVSPIMRSMNSTKLKYFEIRPSQTRNIKNFGRGSVDCPKITEDKSSKSRVQTPDATNHSHYRSTKMRGSKPASQHYCSNITTVSRREGRNLRLYFTTMTKTQSPEPTSHTKLDAKLEAHISTKGKVQTLPQWLNARLEARISTTEEPCVSVITALITAHVMRELTLIMECFQGTLLPLKPL